MKRDQIVSKVIEIVAHQAGMDGDDLAETTPISELSLDALGGVELAMDLENEFQIEIPDNEVEKLFPGIPGQAVAVEENTATIKSIVDLVESSMNDERI